MIISIYASLLGLLYIGLSVKTINARRKLKIAIGDGNNILMTRAMRAHANFAEYVPIALFLILLIELSQDASIAVHFGAITLLLGRYIHAYGISKPHENFKFRVTGMILTFTSIFVSALFLLIKNIFAFTAL